MYSNAGCSQWLMFTAQWGIKRILRMLGRTTARWLPLAGSSLEADGLERVWDCWCNVTYRRWKKSDVHSEIDKSRVGCLSSSHLCASGLKLYLGFHSTNVPYISSQQYINIWEVHNFCKVSGCKLLYLCNLTATCSYFSTRETPWKIVRLKRCTIIHIGSF